MTVAANLDAGVEAIAGGRSGLGIGAGRGGATALLLGEGQNAGLASGTRSAGPLGEAGFRTSWQAMLRALGESAQASDETGAETGEAGSAGEANGKALPSTVNAGDPSRSSGPASLGSGPLVAASALSQLRAQDVVADRKDVATLHAGYAKDGDAVPSGARSSAVSDGAHKASAAGGERRTSAAGQTSATATTTAADGVQADPANALAAGQIVNQIAAAAQRADVLAGSQLQSSNHAPRSGWNRRTEASAVNGPVKALGDSVHGSTLPVKSAETFVAPRSQSPAPAHAPAAMGQGGLNDREAGMASVATLKQAAVGSADENAGGPHEVETARHASQHDGAGGGSSAEAAPALMEVAKAQNAVSGAQLSAAASLPGAGQSPSADGREDRVSLDRLGLDSSGQMLDAAGKATTHRTGAVGAADAVEHAVAAQPVDASADAGILVRVPASGHAGLGAMQGSSGGAAGAPNGAQTRATFAAMDTGTAVGAPSWVHAGARQAEAGFQDPALGWVGVRADLSGGSVHAALVPGSPEAAQALSAHMAGLNSYLSDQHTPVTTLTMADAAGGGVGTGAGQQQRSGGEDAQGNRSPEVNGSWQQSPQTAGNPPAPAAIESGGLDAGASVGGSRGVHISVMA
ncbi:MAG: hypothetical protein WBC92_19945 [Terracidiphilus sp.]